MILTSLRRHVGISPHPVHQYVPRDVQLAGLVRAFPQHGPGRKHKRPIVLEAWQQAIVEAHPWQFLRGLLHSDGCRTINRFKTKLPERARRRVRVSALVLLEHVGGRRTAASRCWTNTWARSRSDQSEASSSARAASLA